MGEIDQAFVQEQEHRAKHSNTYAEGIPLIDLSPYLSSPDHHDHKTNTSTTAASIDGLVSEIGDACKKWGFFQVVNHGVDLEKRRKLETSAREFFKQSLEEKRKVRRSEKQPLGYYDTEHTKNVRDWKEVFDFLASDPTVIQVSPDPDDKEVAEIYNVWPEYPPELKEVSEEYVKEVEKLAYKLMELIAMSLGLPANRFHSFFREQITRIRLNHYPPCPAADLAMGVGRHKDGSALTILYQDHVGGLQVRRQSDGEWVSVKPTPDAYIINVGDIVQVWSNEAYQSVEHRAVVKSEMDRYSIVFFFGPAHDTMIEPLEELTSEQSPPKYSEYCWGKFFISRRLSNFQKLNVENLQISHFRISE